MTRQSTIAMAVFAATSVAALSAQADQTDRLKVTDDRVTAASVEHTTSADPSVTDREIVKNRPMQESVPHRVSGQNIDDPNAPHPVFIDEKHYQVAETEMTVAAAPEAGGEPIATSVYFPFDKSHLTADAKARLNGFVEYLREEGLDRVAIEGHTDRAGSNAYNVGLSQERATTVASYLEQQGIRGEIGTVDWEGETEPAVETEDGVRLQENRRTEVVAQ